MATLIEGTKKIKKVGVDLKRNAHIQKTLKCK